MTFDAVVDIHAVNESTLRGSRDIERKALCPSLYERESAAWHYLLLIAIYFQVISK